MGKFKFIVGSCYLLKSLLSSTQGHGLKPRSDISNKTKYEKKEYFFGQISGKNSESKQKPAIKKFLKNLQFGINFQLQVTQIISKTITHSIRGVREKLGCNPNCNKQIVINNYVLGMCEVAIYNPGRKFTVSC